MIASKKYVDETLKANNLVANKSLGQNFLVESDIAEYIVNSANITSSTCVIEIGPGLGALTEFAVKQAGLVMAFESLSDRLTGIIKKIKGQAYLTEANMEEMLKEIRVALLEADVNFKVVKEFVN